MTERLKRIISETVKNNLKVYILIIGVFLAGVALSCVLNISAGSEEEIKLYVSDFISNVKNYSTDSLKTFSIAMNGYIQFVGILFLLSLTVIGSVGVLTFVFVKGFSYGIVFTSVFNMMGAKALLFFMCSVIPHALVLLPCFGTYSMFCIKNSYSISKGVKYLKTTVILPFMYGLICILLSSIAALIQAYLEPILLRVII